MKSDKKIAENHFKQSLRRGEKQVGIWITLYSTDCAELLSGADFDWMLFDMEHTCNDPTQVIEMLRAANGSPSEPVVRIPWRDPAIMKRLLDSGVRTFMVPFIQNAEEAAAVISSTRYPPHGIRGVNGTMRANGYGRARIDYQKRYADEICVIVQVETPEAIANIPAIGAVDGVDAIFVGPNDLAANMGLYGQTSHSAVKSAIQEALALIQSTGKAAGILNYNNQEALELFNQGYAMIAVGSDAGLLVRHADELRNSFTAVKRARLAT
ncbi:HpcH/HpaI aldolase family protein [Candidimonas nitroreducens]|nr:HpcH/HpaI aldolase/citrate lyase family protein [Candidimonas nitroreducens]